MNNEERARLAKELAQRGYSDAEIAFLVGPFDEIPENESNED